MVENELKLSAKQTPVNSKKTSLHISEGILKLFYEIEPFL